LNKSMYEDGGIRALADRQLQPNDVVMCDWAAYYVVKPRAKQIYLASVGPAGFPSIGYAGGKLFPDMRDEERQSITLLIARPESLPGIRLKIGGEWEEVDPGCSTGEFCDGPWLQAMLRNSILSVDNSVFHPLNYSLRAYRKRAPRHVRPDSLALGENRGRMLLLGLRRAASRAWLAGNHPQF
jgi:hypothetical protein